jgi:hypothetical protein
MIIRFALALIVTLLAAFPALASPSCMTKHEARAHYQTSYLYWRTEHHCWYASQGSRHHVAKKSAPVVLPAHNSIMELPAAASTGADTASIWPDPPIDFTWADRWPNQDRISPDRWLMELVQFGSRR